MNANQVNHAYVALFNAIKSRQTVQASKDNLTSLQLLYKHEKSVKAGMQKMSAERAAFFVTMQNPESKGENFIAVKANVKIINILRSIGEKSINHIDGYSMTIIANALKNDGVIFAKSALVSLSKDVEYLPLDTMQIISARMRKAASTAVTQRSSTREALRVLQFADTVKGAKDDPTTLTVKGREVFEMLMGISAPVTNDVEESEEIEG